MKKFLSKITPTDSVSSTPSAPNNQSPPTGKMGNGMQVAQVAPVNDLTKVPNDQLTTEEKTRKLVQLDALIKK